MSSLNLFPCVLGLAQLEDGELYIDLKLGHHDDSVVFFS